VKQPLGAALEEEEEEEEERRKMDSRAAGLDLDFASRRGIPINGLSSTPHSGYGGKSPADA